MSKVAGALRKIAGEWREDPSRWTKGCTARDSDGDPTVYCDGSAVSWCALGALLREDLDPDDAEGFLLQARPLRAFLYDSIPGINDMYAMTAKAAAGWFERAADLAEAES